MGIYPHPSFKGVEATLEYGQLDAFVAIDPATGEVLQPEGLRAAIAVRIVVGSQAVSLDCSHALFALTPTFDADIPRTKAIDRHAKQTGGYS